MLYLAGVGSPAATEFFRKIGADEFHFGLLGGIPLVLFLLQFVAALFVGRMRERKTAFMVLLIGSRLVYLPVVLLPFVFPGMDDHRRMILVVGLLAVGSALTNLGTPLWFSWMADLIPHRLLNTYWGARQSWTQVSMIFGLVAVTFVTAFVHWPMLYLFPMITAVAVAAGVMDILLFRRVEEPEGGMAGPPMGVDVLLEPFRHREYRTFLFFSCFWSASTMCAASFMMIYVLDVLHMSVWRTSIVWGAQSVGIALSARTWGRVADRHGHRPILVICCFFKSIVTLVFAIVTPEMAFPVLLPMFFVDGFLNSGMMVASNGFMMKMAPEGKRPAYFSAVTALSGICAGLAVIAAGHFLKKHSGVIINLAGTTWNAYQVLFFLSMLLRMESSIIVRRIREPSSSKTAVVVDQLWTVLQNLFLQVPAMVGLTPANPSRRGRSRR